MHGMHLIKSWASTQTVIAMSSGEGEYYGVVKGACEAIGVGSMLQDLTGRRSHVRVKTDSSAARGIAMRPGVGKVRHLEVRTLWLQDQVDRVLVQIAKIAGETNPADVCTKHLDGRKLRDMLSILPLCFEHGRHALCPQLHGQIQTLTPDDCTDAHRRRRREGASTLHSYSCGEAATMRPAGRKTRVECVMSPSPCSTV